MRLEQKVDDLSTTTERRFGSVEETLLRMDSKLDRVIDQKADKSEVQVIASRMWGLLAGFVLAVIGAVSEFILRNNR